MWRHCYIAVLILVLTTGCKKAEDRTCIKSSGVFAERTLQFPGLRQVKLYDAIDYNFIQDKKDEIVIRGGENLIGLIGTDYQDGILSISDDNKCHWLRSLPVNLQVDIHFDTLDLIYNESSGTCRTIGPIRQAEFEWQNWHTNSRSHIELEAQYSKVSVNAGSSLITLSGNSLQSDIYLSGSSEVNARDFLTLSSYAYNVGSGDIVLNVDGGLLAWKIESHGNIIYHGSPGSIAGYGDSGGGTLISGD